MKVNMQAPEKRVGNSYEQHRNMLDVHSVFSTIQGEGPYCGRPAVFVRLAGCNLQCPGCDTDYTTGRTKYFAEDILRLVESEKIKTGSNTKLIVVTGGEPFRQPIEPFIRKAHEQGYRVQIETNGTMLIPPYIGERCVIVCSPKAAKVHPSVHEYADAFKYVMKADSVHEQDGLPLQALDHTATPFIARPEPDFGGTIYLQPMDEKDVERNAVNIKAVTESCMKHGYTLQLQVHKYIGVE
ncbi:7-carboxy-7-deazaguanine synthase [Hafnia phage yong3]|nr:7-carboxy-7-deazaguanine synthase [Hafnia phage yong3]